MDQVLRYRLALVEKLHRKMRGYRIADGRVTFRSDRMWEASFAYGGDNDDEGAEWYLLSITFLFRVSEASGGQSTRPAVLLEANQAHSLVEYADGPDQGSYRFSLQPRARSPSTAVGRNRSSRGDNYRWASCSTADTRIPFSSLVESLLNRARS